MLIKAEIKTNMRCPMGPSVTEMVEAGKASFNTRAGVIAGGKLPVYVDDVNEDARYGEIVSVSKETGEALDIETLSDLLKGEYEVKLTGVNGKLFMAEIAITEKAMAVASGKNSPELNAAIAEKVNAGIVSQETADEIVAYLKRNLVQEDLIIENFRKMRTYKKSAHTPKCMYEDPFLPAKLVYGEEGIIAKGLRNSLYGFATVCEGDKSVGKNVYMETIAWVRQQPLYMIAWSRYMAPGAIYGEKSTDNSASQELMGMKREAMAKVMLDSAQQIKKEDVNKALDAAADFELAKARAASVSIVIDYSEFYEWCSDGGTMVFNEMNMAEPNFFSQVTNPLTDGTGFIVFPGRGEVKVNPDCCLFGTQNADYEGTQAQNSATISRFNSIIFRQPESVEKLLRTAVASELRKCGCTYQVPDKYFTAVQKFYTQCMNATHSGAVSNEVLNIRGLVRALAAVGHSNGYVRLKDWVEMCVVNSCPSDERESIESFLKATITI